MTSLHTSEQAIAESARVDEARAEDEGRCGEEIDEHVERSPPVPPNLRDMVEAARLEGPESWTARQLYALPEVAKASGVSREVLGAQLLVALARLCRPDPTSRAVMARQLVRQAGFL